MFTSRAEYRLQLREDNADLRLTSKGRELGLIDDARWGQYCRKREAVESEARRLRATWARPHQIPESIQEDIFGKPLEREHSLFDLLRRPDVKYAALAPLLGSDPADDQIAEQVEIEAKYAGYIERQKDEVARQAAQESTVLPADMDYLAVRGLSREVQQKLAQHRPETIGQASRIQGVTPAAIALLLVHLKRRSLARATLQEKQA